MERSTRTFLSSFLCTFLAILSLKCFFKLLPTVVTTVGDYTYLFEHWFKSTLLLFIFLVAVFASLSFIVGAIMNMFLFFYYTFFYTFKFSKMEILIDQNDFIQDSFVEYKNGDRLPVEIKRMVTNLPKEPNEVVEEKVEIKEEENKNE